jgi:hypothetical protein
MLPAPRRTPLTFGYLVLLVASTVVLHVVSPATRTLILGASSTDVWHLTRDPVRVLVASAVWVPGATWWLYVALLAVVLTPLERRLGGLRTALIFATGHVLATLGTEVPIGVAVAGGWLPAAAAHRFDVGVSYGLAAAGGAAIGLLRRPVRYPLLAAATVVIGVPLLRGPGMTTAGHAIALLCGVAWWPWLARGESGGAGRPRLALRRRG